MKILILDAYYRGFLLDFYKTHPEIQSMGFNRHRHALMLERFGSSDAYSFALRELGYEAQEIIADDNKLQAKWAREHRIFCLNLPRRLNQVANKFFSIDFRYRILRKQIEDIRPDILYVQEQNILSDAFLASLKQHCKYLVCQVASEISKRRTYKSYDLVLTSLPHFVDRFRQQGIRARYLPLGFDDRVLSEIPQDLKRKYDLTFIGGFSRVHKNRYQMLEQLSHSMNFDIFGYTDALSSESPLAKFHRGEVWGLNMYKVLAESRITLNNHEQVASRFANNMRLFEATGVGACLLTDAKDNLGELFEPDKEVVAFSSIPELIDKTKYLLEHEDVRADIARAGQKRTLKDHTFQKRMEETISIFDEELR